MAQVRAYELVVDGVITAEYPSKEEALAGFDAAKDNTPFNESITLVETRELAKATRGVTVTKVARRARKAKKEAVSA